MTVPFHCGHSQEIAHSLMLPLSSLDKVIEVLLQCTMSIIVPILWLGTLIVGLCNHAVESGVC